jgi:hypothetical protein
MSTKSKRVKMIDVREWSVVHKAPRRSILSYLRGALRWFL